VRYSVALIGLCASLIVGSHALAAPKRGGLRKVQFISMMRNSPVEEAAPTPTTAEEGQTLEEPSLPVSFEVHDLSRRYVQFRMQQELKVATSQAALGDRGESGAIGGVPTKSSLAVPAWLRGNAAMIAPVAFRAECTPLSYQSSGFLPRSAEARRAAYYGMMSAIACEQGIPTGLFDAVIMRESGYNPIAISSANAYGLAQLMPGTAAGLGVNRYDPVENLRGGARYLRQQLDRFGQVHLALAAYNAGPGRVRGGMVPRITETQAYVSNIIANWSRLTSPASSPSSEYNPPASYTRVAVMQRF
jgi:hypothetical protein